MSRIRETFEGYAIPWSEEKEKLFDGYRDRVLEMNRQMNLTAITYPEEFTEKHYIDSLTCAKVPEFLDAQTVIDVGTGGGFPGVPLAVAFPEKEFTLVDSLAKRIRFIEETCRNLGIDNVTALHGRAEDLAREADLREGFDACVSRAVAPLNVLCELCLPFLRVGGVFIAYKGKAADEELAEAQAAIAALGGQAADAFAGKVLPGQESHRLLVIRKVSPTEERFPRRAGIPSKRPL